MSPFAKLMLRFGWIRLSSYGLEVTLDGRLVSAGLLPEAQLDLDWSNVPAPAVDLASTFDPALGARPARTPPPLPAPRARQAVAATAPASPPPAVAQAPKGPATQPASAASADSLSEEEEWAWQAAVAKAKAESETASQVAQMPTDTDDEATGFADTEKLPSTAVKQSPPPAKDEPDARDTQVAAEVAESDGEDWEVLVAAARSREERAEPSSHHNSSYDDTKIDALPKVPDFAAAQVTQGDLPANDDLPADAVTSIHALKLRSMAAPQTPASASSEDDEWTAMRSQIEAREREENARKMRAMREIQRLQGRASLGGLRPNRPAAPPHRKRMAAGTLPAPARRPALSTSTVPTLRPSTAAAPADASGHDTKIDLPRVTERLSR